MGRLEDWIFLVETLTDEDGELLLSKFDDEENEEEYSEEYTDSEIPRRANTLKNRLEEFLGRAVPDQNFIDDLQNHATNTMGIAISRIIQTWSLPTITPDAQRSLSEHTSIMTQKVNFLVTIYKKMLESNKWKKLHMSIYKAVNNILLKIITLAEQYSHHPNDFVKTLIHFEVKSFITNCSRNTWEMMMRTTDGISSHRDAKLTRFPTSFLVPSMRKLGMMDVLDDNWMMYGGWSQVGVELGRRAVPFDKKNADKILEEKSMVWKNSRNSLRCRMWAKNETRSMPPAPQCFQYFSKCSVSECSSIETSKKPHKHRCIKCWYFHFCSDSCKRYATIMNLHDCTFTPPEMVQLIKRETESYLGLKNDDHNDNTNMCNFCSTNKIDLPGNVLHQCSKCQVVAYCDRKCQAWDWPDHKQRCKKK